jgi:hypothetical protein
MKILLCGGRNYCDAETVRQYLDPFLGQITMLIQGGARGADRLAKEWARGHGVHGAEVEALWQAYSRAGGARRNSAMLVLEPDLCIAFPGGPGTADMVKQCKRANIMVIEVIA